MIEINNFQLSTFNITKKCAKIYSKDARKKVSQKFRNAEGGNNENLSLENLKDNGLKTAPQGPLRVASELLEYIEKYI